MTRGTLTLRELNRATLARQMLLERSTLSITEAIEQVGGLQAQVPNPPYIGLWSRLQGFQKGDLTQLMEEREVVRAAMMRSTLHLVTAKDHDRFRGTLQPALTRAFNSFFGKRARELDEEKLDRLLAAARPFLEERPRSTGELRELLSTVEPDADPEAMAYAVRTYLPLVQVAPAGTWGSGSRAEYTTADSWLKDHRPPELPEHSGEQPEDLDYLLRRYLAAFGPASIKDFGAWSGLTGLGKQLERLKSGLVTYESEDGAELLDLPDAPLPPPDTPAPAHLVPEYDNLVLSHADRRRVIADEHRGKVFLSAARVRATFLVDGFVAGVWKVEKIKKDQMRLVLESLEPLPEQAQADLREEGERLLRFVSDGAGDDVVLLSASYSNFDS